MTIKTALAMLTVVGTVWAIALLSLAQLARGGV